MLDRTLLLGHGAPSASDMGKKRLSRCCLKRARYTPFSWWSFLAPRFCKQLNRLSRLFQTEPSLRIDMDETLTVHRHVIFIVQNDKRFNCVGNGLQPGINLQSPLSTRDVGLTDHAPRQQTGLLQR